MRLLTIAGLVCLCTAAAAAQRVKADTAAQHGAAAAQHGAAAAQRGADDAVVVVAQAPCDVFIAGGSLASLAAAVTAANVSAELSVCYVDFTDWVGGQLTASGVPAVDFGPHNSNRFNLPASLRAILFGPAMPGDTNLGECWVSKKCFRIPAVMDGILLPLLASFPNLRTFRSTAVLQATRDAASGNVTRVRAVQRTPAAGTSGWEALLSAQVSDFYSPTPSAAFGKAVLDFPIAAGGIVIEATEFGDVLASAGLPMAQGIEAPYENSTASQTYCGQASTIPFWINYSAALAPTPDPTPAGSDEGEPWSSQGLNWTRVWTYRRSLSTPGTTIDEVRVGDVSNQNVGGGNDLVNAYLFLPTDSPEFAAQLAPGAWRGGLNLTALAMGEQRAFGYYHHYKHNNSEFTAHLQLAPEQAGTLHGLAKMPYLRDARRSAAGLGGYRLTYHDIADADPRNASLAVRWPDTVAIGGYWFADCHVMNKVVCPLPAYLTSAAGSPIKPYFIPFRALTVSGAPNVLVAGKSMAQTFWANAGTRLHPEEWSTGVAAGAAAALMSLRGWDTAAALANVGELQTLLLGPTVDTPLWWNLTSGE